MFMKLHALYAPEPGDAGSGADGGGSSKDGSGGDKDVVPKSQFIAALNSAEAKRERELASLRQEFEAKLEAATAKRDQPKTYTRQELRAAVEAGQITQEQADAEVERQIRAETRAAAEQTAHETVTLVERRKQIDGEINRYKAVAPEILDDSSETRQAIKVEFSKLVELGDDPKDLSTQYKAIRAVLGPVERLEKARSGTSQHDTHRETGGGGGGGGGGKKTGKLSDQLNSAARKHYEKQIEQGLVKDWAAVDDELKYASPNVRQRLGIAA